MRTRQLAACLVLVAAFAGWHGDSASQQAVNALSISPEDIAGLQGRPPASPDDQKAADDLASDLARAGLALGRRSTGQAAIDTGALADEFESSLPAIAQEQQRLIELEAARERERQRQAQLASQRAAEEQARMAAATRIQNLENTCNRNLDRCLSRCSGASNSAIAGGIADAFAGRAPTQQVPSYRACASQCRAEGEQCTAAASSGRSHTPGFTGGSGGGASPAYPGSGGNLPGMAGAGDVNSPQCRAAQAEAERAMSGLGRASGMCAAARESIALSRAGLRYVQLCPAADPGGAQAREYQDAIRQAQQVERNSCM